MISQTFFGFDNLDSLEEDCSGILQNGPQLASVWFSSRSYWFTDFAEDDHRGKGPLSSHLTAPKDHMLSQGWPLLTLTWVAWLKESLSAFSTKQLLLSPPFHIYPWKTVAMAHVFLFSSVSVMMYFLEAVYCSGFMWYYVYISIYREWLLWITLVPCKFHKTQRLMSEIICVCVC